MRTPEDHLADLRQLVPPRPVITIPLIGASGHRLAGEVRAREDSPRFDNSQMDGYALSATQLARTPASFPVGPTIAAGQDPDLSYPVGLTEAIAPIMTGAKVPAETAGIVPVERCSPQEFAAEGELVEVPVIPVGQFIRRAASDISAGTPLLPAGHLLGPLDIGLLASQSLKEVEVHPRTRVLICSGGAEIGSQGVASIPDSNGPMLQALCEAAGIEVAHRILTDDDPGKLGRELKEAIAQHEPDAVITSGGISHGKFEVIRQVLEIQPGAWFGHVAQQPGGPQGFALFEGVPVICLPGNPISTLVSFRLFVAPLLGEAPEPLSARLSVDTPGLAEGRTQLRRGTHRVVDTQLEATPLSGAGSHLLARAAGANCLIRIPGGAQLRAGDPVTIYPF
ncbi:Molybdopterin molybdenumtransferase [Corynebacterium occultum]|uniref:Molybdopterin molybdenumtransferase n=1 Tax=Corynebacterium occultum TaxID=2675219 RepID=A0A6B8W481_9CORY|nr:molybdopterin molybdotransferase MoeA [Corynebacterium occultum]QGU06215.1 Molybdopterin molybdenumtransferase [Corynebacterium occultum]